MRGGQVSAERLLLRADQQIYWSNTLGSVLTPFQDSKYAGDYVMAHEFGHAIQGRTGILTSRNWLLSERRRRMSSCSCGGGPKSRLTASPASSCARSRSPAGSPRPTPTPCRRTSTTAATTYSARSEIVATAARSRAGSGRPRPRAQRGRQSTPSSPPRTRSTDPASRASLWSGVASEPVSRAVAHATAIPSPRPRVPAPGRVGGVPESRPRSSTSLVACSTCYAGRRLPVTIGCAATFAISNRRRVRGPPFGQDLVPGPPTTAAR